MEVLVADGEQVYVSQVSGEVVQYTTTASRLGAYLGAIPHWLYFTPLRKHGRSGAGSSSGRRASAPFAAILGVAIGVWMYSPSKRYRNAGVADQHSVSRTEALAHGARSDLRVAAPRPGRSAACSRWIRFRRRRRAEATRGDIPAGASRRRAESRRFPPRPAGGARAPARTSASRSWSSRRLPASRSTSPRSARADTRIVPVERRGPDDIRSRADHRSSSRTPPARRPGGAARDRSAYDRYYLDRRRSTSAAGDPGAPERRRPDALLHRPARPRASSAPTARATG